MKTYPAPSPSVSWASEESTVSSLTGTIPSRWMTATNPTNIETSSATITVSVARAFFQAVGLNTGTALEIASIPVIAVAPEENARNTNSAVTPSTAAGFEVGGWASKPLPPRSTRREAAISRNMAPTKA